MFVSVEESLVGGLLLFLGGRFMAKNTQRYVRGGRLYPPPVPLSGTDRWDGNLTGQRVRSVAALVSPPAEPKQRPWKARCPAAEGGSMQVRLELWESVECVVAEGRGSGSRGSHKISLPLLATIQPTPYLIALISILSRGVDPAPLLCTFLRNCRVTFSQAWKCTVSLSLS